MHLSKILLSGSEYFILNKTLIKVIGIDATVILSQLVEYEELSEKRIRDEYFHTTIDHISNSTTLSVFKIKNSINNLYKKNIIDIIVNKNGTISVKILHDNILNILSFKQKPFKKNKEKTHSINKHKRFKKPKRHELQKYFLEISELDESDIMFDYYESKGWKVGKAPMKCWKSAARNWIRRGKKTTHFPDHYDKKLELKLGNDTETLSQYHNHLKKLGWIATYTPSAGITWKKNK